MQCYLFQTYAVVMHSPEFCNKIVKLTADDREIEVIEKGMKRVLYSSPILNPVWAELLGSERERMII